MDRPQGDGNPVTEQRSAPQPAGPVYEDEIDLLDYVEVIVRRRWLIVLGTVICAAATLVYGKLTPEQNEYRAEANVLVREEPVMTPSGQVVQAASVNLSDLQRYDVRRGILDRLVPVKRDGEQDSIRLWDYFNGASYTIRQALDRLTEITEIRQDNAGVVTISVTMGDSAVAAIVANGYVKELINFQTEAQQYRIREEVAFIEERQAVVEGDLRAAEDSLLTFKRKHRGLPRQGVPVEELEMQLSWHQRRVDARAGLYNSLLNQHEQALLRAKLARPKLQVINYAFAETAEQTAWGVRRKATLGGAVGLVLSIFLAFIFEYIDRNRKSGRLDPIIRELTGRRGAREK
jgi:uncharacterized protein involved in exopolysaccharide biosynthesis